MIGNGLTLELIEIPYLPDVIEQARARVKSFWEMIAIGKLPEPDYGRDGEVIAQVFAKDDGTEIDLTGDNEIGEIIDFMEGAKLARKTAQDGIDQAQAQILHKLGNAATAKFAGGVISAKTIQRKAYEVQASSYRRLHVKQERAKA